MQKLVETNNDELETIKNLMSLKIAIQQRKNELENELNCCINRKFPNQVINILNRFVEKNNYSIFLDSNLKIIKEEYRKRVPKIASENDKTVKKIRIKKTLVISLTLLFLILLILFIVLCVKLDNDVLPFITLGIFISFIVWICVIYCSFSFTEAKNKIDKAKTDNHVLKIYDYNILFSHFSHMQNLNVELNSVRENEIKLNGLIVKQKSMVKIIPEKYVDYISPVDKVPAVYDFLEIISDRRADTIKELINVYKEDEFKKESIRHMYTMEKLMQ